MFMRTLVLSVVPALAIGGAACSKKAPQPEPTKAPPAETTPAEADAAPAPATDAAPAPAPDAAPAPAPDAAPAPAPDAAPAPAPDAAAAPAADAAPAPAPDAAAAPAADAAAAPAGPAAVFSTDGFSTPESVLVTADAYLVSNINGNPLDKDDNGFISKLGADGKIIELKWIDGAKADVELHAPKGMGIQNGVLYVADVDTVRKFDATTGAPLGAIAVPNAVFLNDVAALADGKTVYVTDSAIGPDFKPKGTPAVYAISGEDAPKALEITTIGLPNGVAVEASEGGDVVYFNGFDDTKVIHRFATADKAASTVAVPAGQLDGLALVKDGEATWLITSSWESGSVYKIDKDGKATAIASGLKGPADFGVDAARKLVIVPVFMENRVAAFAL